jgi:hypothetical protein
MARSYFPKPTNRSNTALPGQGSISDKTIYSSIVAAQGGSSAARAFTTAQSAAIVRFMGSGIAPTEAHHLLNDWHSTNLEKPSEVAGSIGDARIRGISVQCEVAGPLNAGSFTTYGMTPQDLCEFLSKVYCKFYIGGNEEIVAPVSHFPAAGGPAGTVFCAAAATTSGMATNGSSMVGGRKLKIALPLGQTDLVSMQFACGNGSSLVFFVTTGVGQSSLVTTFLSVFARKDVRA